jgi:hypothetical protein
MEKLFWGRLQRYLKANKKGFWVRIESPVSPGVPDLLICYEGKNILVELKWSESKKLSSRALTYKLSKEQIIWFTKSDIEKCPSFVLLGSDFGAILLSSHIAKNLNQMSLEEAKKAAEWYAIRSFSGLFESLFKKGNNGIIRVAEELPQQISTKQGTTRNPFRSRNRKDACSYGACSKDQDTPCCHCAK